MFRYKILFDDENTYTENTESGIVAASSYEDAVKKLADYYGEKNIIALGFYELCDKVITEDVIREEFATEFKI